ncbi:MAG TPA: universal stress protein [Anaerolineae bacterium]|jgi:nucleotide-binding universal stress UspA family protein|nr:universal stress protein [Anaerolineae bacterium]
MGRSIEAIKPDNIGEIEFSVNRILLATDGSAPAIMATKYAIALSKMFSASLKIVFVDTAEEQINYNDNIAIIDTPKETRPSTAGLTIAQIYADKNGINYTTEVIKGNVAKTIIRSASDYEADLIIIGNTGRTGLKRLTLGSVAEAVVKSSSIPVLVIKGN